jgi:hypothetical protein
MMSSIRKTMVRSCALVSISAAAMGLAHLRADATTTPGQWNLASNGVDASSRSFTGSDTISFTGTYNGNGATVTCNIGGGFSYTVADPTPHAAPGGTISIQIDPPDNLAPTFGTCTEGVTGGPVSLSTTPGSLWTVTFTTPTATSPSPNNGAFTGALTIPANSIQATASNLAGQDGGKCTLSGPTSALTITKNYDGSTGVATKVGTPVFGLNRSLCSAAGAQAALRSSQLTLWEVGSPNNHPNLIYVP